MKLSPRDLEVLRWLAAKPGRLLQADILTGGSLYCHLRDVDGRPVMRRVDDLPRSVIPQARKLAAAGLVIPAGEPGSLRITDKGRKRLLKEAP